MDVDEDLRINVEVEVDQEVRNVVEHVWVDENLGAEYVAEDAVLVESDQEVVEVDADVVCDCVWEAKHCRRCEANKTMSYASPPP